MSSALAKAGKRWLYIVHRWVGIVTCLLCAIWFVSGVVMMYVPYPALTAPERVAGTPPIDWARVRLSPEQAMAAAPAEGFPRDLRLDQMAGEPAYRITERDGSRVVLSAVDGRRIGPTDARAAEAIARTFSGAPGARWVRTIERDQWTVAQRYNRDRPLHVISLGDAAGTELYVSSTEAAVVADTHGTERFWNWLGSVPHWIYFTVIRTDGEFWRQVVMWTSFPALVGAAAGIWIGVLRMRLRRRYKGDRITPYLGWMKWHHIAGLLFGVFVATWLFSGWLSVNPFRWFARDGMGPDAAALYAGAPGRSHPGQARLEAGVREVRYVWIAGAPYMLAATGADRTRLLDAQGRDARLSDEQLFQAARRMLPGALVASEERLTEPDAYWYSHHNPRPLPILRVKFADEAATWVHLDPATGLLAGETNRSGRTYRWLFNALHSFDFGFLLRHRPAWDIVVWALSIGGTVVSVSGVVIGWRRLKKKVQPQRRPGPRPGQASLTATATQSTQRKSL